jgi:hypothetical protein
MDTKSLEMSHPLLGEITIPVFVENEYGFGSADGSPVVGDGDAEIVGITALWLNLPRILASSAECTVVNATDRITEMLASCSIDTTIPDDLEALLDLATEPGTTAPQSGPGVAAWVRNRLTHPKDPSAPYDIESLVWHTKVLLLEYLDLTLLHEMGYAGGWSRLYPPGRWSGTTEPVPWST